VEGGPLEQDPNGAKREWRVYKSFKSKEGLSKRLVKTKEKGGYAKGGSNSAMSISLAVARKLTEDSKKDN